jgi:hypothetical protein
MEGYGFVVRDWADGVTAIHAAVDVLMMHATHEDILEDFPAVWAGNNQRLGLGVHILDDHHLFN